ncbi:MAG TPA: hypothetical protein VKG25_09170 [Bryobacteraceae bacterium]|nr:hypothetical protein [Bryobacteraceae bacterium]
MKLNLCLMAGLIAAVSCGIASAQDGNATPRYVVLLPSSGGSSSQAAGAIGKASAPLPTWNGSFTYKNKNYTYNMVGTAPSTNTSTTIQAVIIPVKIVLSGGSTFDPEHVLPNGKTVVQNTVASPLFDSTTTYTVGSTDVGTTQYIDAYQRANFWGTVASEPNYHLLLSAPTVLAEQTLSPSSRNGKSGNPFGNLTVAEVNINWFDSQIQSLITKLGILPNQIPIFLTYDTYLTQNGGCCIGGYHSSFSSSSGEQSYIHASYIGVAGDFAQDVSALSHELGEWATDPLVVNTNGNQTPCGILEVGDPLEGEANYGGFPYTVNGFTYNLQDLVMLPYFGAPTSTSVNGWLSFHDAALTVCSNGS